MSTTRTFVAIEIPEQIRAKLARLQTLLAAEVSSVRWTGDAGFHLTLAFIGDVQETDLHTVCRAVERAVVGKGPVELRVEGLGVFPNAAKPRVLWAGIVGDGVSTLVELHRRIAAALAEVGYPLEDSPYNAHITLGRPKLGRGPAQPFGPLIKQYQAWSAGSFRAAEVITYASTLTPDGPVYVPLAQASLVPEKTRPSP